MIVSETSDAERVKAQTWQTEFQEALARTAASVAGLNCHTLRDQPHLGLPRLFWDGDLNGAYWASAGLVFTANPADTLTKATATLQYHRHSADGDHFTRNEQPLTTLDIGTTDPRLVAALLVTAAQHHRPTL